MTRIINRVYRFTKKDVELALICWLESENYANPPIDGKQLEFIIVGECFQFTWTETIEHSS